ncbi:hypothetical protein B0H13DRAFT_1584907, partial [Mycena leptocephala]
LQFQLARCYQVEFWIEPAFCNLVEMPIVSLNMDHMEQIGPHGSFHLVQTQGQLLKVPRELAFHIPPTTHDNDCVTPAFCNNAWAREWGENVPRIIHHPEVPCD